MDINKSEFSNRSIVTISSSVLPMLLKKNASFEALQSIVEQSEKLLRSLGQSSNYSIFMTHNGIRYRFGIYFGMHEFTIWDDNDFSLGNYPIDTNSKITPEFIAWVQERFDNYEKGLIRCCDCGELISIAENSEHRYFAGIYCSKCWSKTWAEVESEETYN